MNKISDKLIAEFEHPLATENLKVQYQRKALLRGLKFIALGLAIAVISFTIYFIKETYNLHSNKTPNYGGKRDSGDYILIAYLVMFITPPYGLYLMATYRRQAVQMYRKALLRKNYELKDMYWNSKSKPLRWFQRFMGMEDI